MIYKYQRIFIILVYIIISINIVNITERNYISSSAQAATLPPVVDIETKTSKRDVKDLSKKYAPSNYSHSEQLSDSELVSVLKEAGFTGESLRVAWAIAKKESNGRPLAFNGDKGTGDQSYGIFQINMIGDLGSDRRDKYNLESNKELFNPLVNATIAYKMSAGGNDWGAWGIGPTSYKSDGSKSEAYLKWYRAYPN